MLANITEALRRGDTAAAVEAARAAVAAQPGDAQAQHLLGLALQRSGDVDGARAAIDRAIALAPDRSMFQLSRASLALGESDLALAEQGMREALELDPNQLPAYVALVHLALAQGRNEEAARHLKLAQRVDDEHPQVLVAEGHVAQLAGRSEDALRCFTAAVKADPRLPLAQVSLGMAYLGRGHWTFAEQALRNALALDAGNPGVLRALAESLRRQDKLDAALEVLDQLVALRADAPARAVRAELRLIAGRDDEALEDLGAVLDELPALAPIVNAAVATLTRHGRVADALARIEAALAAAPGDQFWALRLGLAAATGEAIPELLDRWQAQSPDSPMLLETRAVYAEGHGRLDEAEAFADRALALQPQMVASQFIKLRAEMRRDPAAVLARLDLLAPAARTPDAERMVLGWRGLAMDRLGRPAEAAEAWREMIRRALPDVRLPMPFPAESVPPGEAAGQLLWAPPGVRLERVLQALDPCLPGRLLADRTSAGARDDGFGLERASPGSPEAGSAERWRAALAVHGLDPATVVDWIPHFDRYTAAALAGARVVAVLVDPRDALLNWMVFGSAQGYRFIPETRRVAEWLALALEALADHREQFPDRVSLVAVDAIEADPEAAAANLQSALGLDQRPDAGVLGARLLALGGLPNQFPAGHWRAYRAAFADEFARLTPVAQRLGYPAD